MEQQNMDSAMEKNHMVTESPNQTQQSKSLEDIMYQRMKNRERQRRYRERKRLLADTNNKSVQMIEPTTPQPPQPPSSSIVPYQSTTRVRRTRDWKKDARRAHTAKRENSDAVLSNGDQVPCLVSGTSSSEHMSKNGEKSKVKSSRRDWKAEARKKRTGETK